MSERTQVALKDRRTGTLVEAILIDGVTEGDVQAAESTWKPFLETEIRRMENAGVPKDRLPQHRHWDWRQKYGAIEGYAAYQMFGIECESEMQGMMLVSTAGKVCRIESQKGKSLVYVHFLAAAPWNLASIVAEPRFSLIGSILLATAIQLSIQEEFSGRIGLHSLPQADGWYANDCGMTDLGCDAAAHNLRYFEMTAEQASEFLK
jgi:hypothetical protein